MVVDELKSELNEKGKVVFKLYSLDYEINKEGNRVFICATLYSNKKNYYDSIDDLLNYYTIYNESLIENADRIILIKDKVGQ